MSLPGHASAPTMIADHGGHAPLRRATTGMPALAQPQEPKMNTMRIATPLGYSSRPQRKVWPVVLVMALLVGLAGGALVVALSGRGSDAANPGGEVAVAEGNPGANAAVTGGNPGANAAVTGGNPGANAAVTGGNPDSNAARRTAGSAAAGAVRAPRSSTAHLTIDSVPPGAAVSGPAGEALGRTPLKLDWPVSDLPVTFELRLAGYKKKQKQTVVNSNTALHIELERAPVVRRPGGAGGSAKAGSGSGSGSNGLMRPE
jgi:hypothetical protein